MKKFISKIVIPVVLLFTTHVLFAETYVRPIRLPKGVNAKIICVATCSDGTCIVVDQDRNDKSYRAPQDKTIKKKTYYLLLPDMWLETPDAKKGDVKLGDKNLPLDNVQFSGVTVSPYKERETIDKHKAVSAKLSFQKIVYKFKDTLELSEHLRDSVLREEIKLNVRLEDGNPDYRVILNDTILLPDSYKAGIGNEINLTPDQISSAKAISVTVIPDGRIPFVKRNLKMNIAEDRTTIPPAPHRLPIWRWILLVFAIILFVAAVVLACWFLFKKYYWMVKIREKDDKIQDQDQIIQDKDITIQDRDQKIQDKVQRIAALERDVQELKTKLKRNAPANSDGGSDETQEPASETEVKAEADSSAKEESPLFDQEELDKRIAQACEVEREKSSKEIQVLKDEKEHLEKDIENLEQEGKKSEQKITALKNDLDALRKELNTEKEQAQKQVEAVREEEKQNAKNRITELQKSHQDEVERLEAAQKLYTEKIAFVPYAAQYAKDISSLIDTVNEINNSAMELAKADVEDPYLILKAIRIFNLAQSEIDYEDLLLDVSLAAKNDMSFANSGISNLKTVAPDQMFSSLRSYFLSAYLEKYINAAVVYNESLAGLDRLVVGLDSSLTAPFKQYREQLKDCCKRLGIAVISVKLFDTLGDNVDLKATMVDFDDRLPADSIIAIENCLVYPEGGRRPTEKIFVKAQK